jgi:LCP family protein required for cell wall assembly
VSNRGYSNHRRRRLRVTGRFYAFLTMLVVVVVFVGVLIGRGGSNKVDPQAPSIQPITMTTPTILTAPTPAPAVPATVPDPTSPEIAPAPVTDYPMTAEPGAAESAIGAYDASEEDEYELISEEDKVKIKDLSVTQGLDPAWYNILLLGSDSRNINNVKRTDTIMIASINANTGRVKLVSIMRDLVVQAETKNGSKKDVKINALVNLGGVNLLMKTINELFGLNITEYALVNFASFQKVVDILGGVEIDITAEEMEQINISLGEMAKAAGYDQDYYLANRDALSLKVYGPKTKLTGIQALGYARIRHVGAGDYQRTERQRNLLDAILRKVQSDVGLIQVSQLAYSMWGELNTNIDITKAIGLGFSVIKNGAVKLDQTWRIPGTSTSFKSEKRASLGSALYDCDFEHNKQILYNFIYET